MTERFANSVFERALEDPEEAVITRPVAETDGLQPEDIGVLVHLLLLSPTAQATGKDLVAMMRALGWKMSDERFAKIAKRLTAAGHLLRKSVYNATTQRPEWRYRAYRNPANNPQYTANGIDALSQVSDENRKKRGPEPGPASENREKRVSPGQSRKPLFPASGAETAKSGFPSDDVSAGQSRNPQKAGSASPPPHPPEEEDSSSPNPLTRASESLPSQRAAGPEFPREEVEAAADFLQQMRQWQAGASTARRAAPRLLRTMRAQGWPLLADMDQEHRELLEADILKNTAGAKSWTRCLPGWVDDLRRYRKPAPAAAPAAAGPDPRHLALLRAACPACDQSGWVEDDDDDAPPRRCTHPGITVDTAKERQQ
ncbi:hypothetical protein AB0N09_39990 [Streptomyces erythrochromogenes]|uniref:hypothetical protein n=1 Tax=Streptomyces erythrochromogenes TaxID=285574 RepID=UPI0034337747